MRFSLKDFDSFKVSTRPNAYYVQDISEARRQLIAERLAFDTDTGIVSCRTGWVERPTSPPWQQSDRDNYQDAETVWLDYFNRHICARAARIHNRRAA